MLCIVKVELQITKYILFSLPDIWVYYGSENLLAIFNRKENLEWCGTKRYFV